MESEKGTELLDELSKLAVAVTILNDVNLDTIEYYGTGITSPEYVAHTGEIPSINAQKWLEVAMLAKQIVALMPQLDDGVRQTMLAKLQLAFPTLWTEP